MIDLYYCGTPNGLKMTVFLEEAQLPHRVIKVDIGKGEQFRPDFLVISPNGKIPAMIDHAPADGGEPIALFESGAMLLYLADKIGRFMPSAGCEKVGTGFSRKSRAKLSESITFMSLD